MRSGIPSVAIVHVARFSTILRDIIRIIAHLYGRIGYYG